MASHCPNPEEKLAALTPDDLCHCPLLSEILSSVSPVSWSRNRGPQGRSRAWAGKHIQRLPGRVCPPAHRRAGAPLLTLATPAFLFTPLGTASHWLFPLSATLLPQILTSLVSCYAALRSRPHLLGASKLPVHSITVPYLILGGSASIFF